MKMCRRIAGILLVILFERNARLIRQTSTIPRMNWITPAVFPRAKFSFVLPSEVL